ncbi:MAG: glucose-6-phosphate isomerase [Candidatus Limnocylindrales bacterium]|jgi:glucose-6-phosphate isomerase
MTDPATARSLALNLTLADPGLEAALAAACDRAVKEDWADRAIGRRDPSVWTDQEIVKRAIATRLGWLEAPFHFADETGELKAFAAEVRDQGFTTAVLGGMGGSSLAPALLADVFGAAEDGIAVRVLDSTDPAAVAATLDDLDPTATLFIVSTKSGTTAESLSFQAYQWERTDIALEEAGIGRPAQPGDFMAAITDPDPSLRAIPHHDQLREVFINPPDVGGRYSALTYVGLVPGALLGIDLDALLEKARAMVIACGVSDPAKNPGLALGLAMGVFAKEGRDKLTFVIDRELAAFGPWVEQLIAESTGKAPIGSADGRGVGVVPVDGEHLAGTEAYGNDRVFVRITLDGSVGPDHTTDSNVEARLAELAAAGQPIIRISVGSKIELGAEFVRWEVATALAGAVLGIDPFDQPNVEEAKVNTRAILSAMESGAATGEDETAIRVTDAASLGAALKAHLGKLEPNGYASIQAYIAQTPDRDEALAGIRIQLRDATKRATTVGYGPRFLHSTGQLHKGGAPIGWFLQLVSEHAEDRGIPGKAYTFGQLIDAQAIGDAQTIGAHDLPILRINLGQDPDAGLAAFARALGSALKEA